MKYNVQNNHDKWLKGRRSSYLVKELRKILEDFGHTCCLCTCTFVHCDKLQILQVFCLILCKLRKHLLDFDVCTVQLQHFKARTMQQIADLTFCFYQYSVQVPLKAGRYDRAITHYTENNTVIRTELPRKCQFNACETLCSF